MKTYPLEDQDGKLYAFEVSNFFLSRGKATKVAGKIKQAELTRKPKLGFSFYKEEVFCEFKINNVFFQIWEPFGDNSRYWVGKKENVGWCDELELVHEEFKKA